MRKILAAAALLLALGVVLGAFGAHGLKTRLDPPLLAVWQTAVQYHLVHGLGMLLVGIAAGGAARYRLAVWSAALLGAGILLFSGSLYLLALTGQGALGAVAPLGGACFILGWLLFAAAAWTQART